MIRSLPQLQKLDNQAIQIEELSEALKKGRILVHPDDDQEIEQEQQYNQPQYNQQTYRNNGQNYTEQYYHSPERSPPRQEVNFVIFGIEIGGFSIVCHFVAICVSSNSKSVNSEIIS